MQSNAGLMRCCAFKPYAVARLMLKTYSSTVFFFLSFFLFLLLSLMHFPRIQVMATHFQLYLLSVSRKRYEAER